MKKLQGVWLLLFFSFFTRQAAAQQPVSWTKMPSLPDSLGFAGMFAGVIGERVFCMGGANFPEAKPWAGGAKRWYDHVFMLEDGEWQRLKVKLPSPRGYGVSVSYQNKIILIGGSNQTSHSSKVLACSWQQNKLQFDSYPDLPFPLANMSGAVVGHLVIISGGSTSPAGAALQKCLGLDLKNLRAGWFEMDPWPGPARLFPVSAAYGGKYYLFSGENTATGPTGQKQRFILQDAYCFTPVQAGATWSGTWEKLPEMPKGMSAGPSPAPFIDGKGFVFWGGVDRVTALYTDAATHPGINADILYFNPRTATWGFPLKLADKPARVTLPVVFWKGKWLYISGEVRPAIRTNTIYGLQ